MLTVLVWYLWMQVLGLVALPLAFRFFRRLPDRGYTFARPLGLLLVSYLLWLGSSLGILRNSLGGILFSIVAVATVSFVFYRRGQTSADPTAPAGNDPGLLAWLRGHLRLVLAVELLFAGALILWSLLRAYSPDLTTAGGEKFMEIMYLNSIGRSEYFPPLDAWLSGYGISYYYLGYVVMALLTRLAGQAAHLTFNVGVASLFALTCTGAFGLVYNLVKRFEHSRTAEEVQRHRTHPLGWGLLGALLVAVLGNLEGFLEVLYSTRALPLGFWRWLDIKDINQPFTGAASLLPTRSGWWWWRASRVIHDLDPKGNSMGIQPINEFPGFSFLLGDMHPHVLALPFVLLALALALNVLFKETEETKGGAGPMTSWLEPIRQMPVLVPLSLGALAFLNTWDFPIYWLIYVAAYGLGRWGRYKRFSHPFVVDVGVTGVALAVLGFALYLPFYIGFQSQAGGLLPTIYVGTRFRQYFVMFAPFLIAIAGLWFVQASQLRRKVSGRRLLGSWAGWTAAFILLPLLLMALIALVLWFTPQGRDLLESIRRIPAVYEIVGDQVWGAVVLQLLGVKLGTWVMPLVVAGLAALGMVLLRHVALPQAEPAEDEGNGRRNPSLHFVSLCAVVGLLLTLSVEYFYLMDVFRARMNTIFKFYFQAWVLMAIASAFAIYWLSRKGGWVRRGFVVVFWLFFAMGMVYPVLGNVSRAGNFAHAPNLDGTAYLAEGQANDLAAIAWLNENVPTGGEAPVILEAPGDKGASYVYEGRVSALTGLPTLLGWSGHEHQWRGSYDVQQAREPDIEALYNSLSIEEALTLLGEYGITYVYVGPLERSMYDPRALEKFEQFLDVVYRNDGVTIYRVRD